MIYKPKFSLKTILFATTVSAVAIYFVPIKYKTTCDDGGRSYVSKTLTHTNINIQGRNKNNSFEDVIVNVPLKFIERSDDPRAGRWKIEFQTNLYSYVKLRKYEILRFQESD